MAYQCNLPPVLFNKSRFSANHCRYCVLQCVSCSARARPVKTCSFSRLAPCYLSIPDLWSRSLATTGAQTRPNNISAFQTSQFNFYEGEASIRGLTIKFANLPPCGCSGSSGQKPQYGSMTLAYQRFTAVLLLIYGSL
jgi:hypothetical protein